MKKKGIPWIIGIILVATGCRPSTYIADEIIEDSDVDVADQTDSENQPPDCDELTASPGDTERTLQVGEDERSYILHIPEAYTGVTPAPLIIDFHAINVTGEDQLSNSSYPVVTDSEGVVMAFPNGLDGPIGSAWNVGDCCVEGADDVAFALAIIEDIRKIACIDPSRIYAVGSYMGGGMAYYLACEAADVFAAVVSSAFDLNEESVDSCTPARPITVLSFRAVEDSIVPYEGGYTEMVPNMPLTFLGAEGTYDRWAEINGCTGDASDVGNGCQLYGASQCDGGVEVMLCITQQARINPDDAPIAWPILKNHTL